MAYTTIKKPSEHFNTVTYTGDGSSSRNITGVGFQPDWLWIKNRDINQWNYLFDAVRGVSKALFSNVTNAESTQSGTQTAFLSDGFTVGNDTASNGNGNGIVAWNWKAGNSAGSSNSDGSTSSTVSANTTAGFSVVKYAGNSGGSGYSATIGHGLGVKPSFMIIKNLTATVNWAVYHKSLNNGTNPEVKYLELNDSNAQLDDAGIFYDTAPTNSVFTVGTSDKTNEVNKNYIAYCFAEKQGYSKFGSYLGNGNADGPFVYTGFKPAFVIIKKTSATDNWVINDNKRVGYNVDNNELFANLSNTEDTNDVLDLVSNGFKIRHTAGRHNSSGATYVYIAFAEQPLIGDNPATAR